MRGKSNEVLNRFIREKSKFLDLPEGHEVIVKFLRADPVETTFNGSLVEAIRYTLEVEGKEMLWDRTSRALAKQMNEFAEGDVLGITRFGQRNQTRYEIRPIKQ